MTIFLPDVGALAIAALSVPHGDAFLPADDLEHLARAQAVPERTQSRMASDEVPQDVQFHVGRFAVHVGSQTVGYTIT